MADALIKYETIDSEQIDDIMAGRPPREPVDSSTDQEPPTGEPVSLDKDKDRRGEKPIGGPAQQH
jgi:cell division protease FtsH